MITFSSGFLVIIISLFNLFCKHRFSKYKNTVTKTAFVENRRHKSGENSTPVVKELLGTAIMTWFTNKVRLITVST